MTRYLLLCTVAGALLLPAHARAAEICGNDVDDDANGLADEGCYPTLTTGVCESPLSCADTGMVSPLTGSLRYQLPPDIAPKVPYGPGIGFRRFYTSQYAPSGTAPVWKKPLGDRWQHTYMAWLTKTGTAPSSTVVLHHRGQDIYAAYDGSGSGWDVYKPQPGFHVQYLRQRQAAPNEFELRTLSGETFVYNSAGKLTEVWDTLATPNKVLVAYDGAGQVSTVTDASSSRRLLFAYTSNVLTSVAFQIYPTGGSWTTYHTTTYGYTSGALTTVTIGGALAQQNIYTSSYLTEVRDAASNMIASFAYTATPGKVARIDTTQGMIGFEYASTRPSCSGKTVLHFNRGNTTSCSIDSDCGSGFLCGGKTGAGTTGVCFRAARCLTVASTNEDVITDVAALGPPSETCTGACAAITQYTWDASGGKLDNTATQDGSGNFTTRVFNANGTVKQLTYGDPDSNPANGNGARTEWRFYDTSFPGLVTEIRRKSDLSTSTCSDTVTTGCARTLYEYYPVGNAASGKLRFVYQSGYTLDASNNPTTYLHITQYTYDAKGRLTQISANVDEVLTFTTLTSFEYYAASGSFTSNFLQYIRRHKASGTLDQRADAYDFWGNPTTLVDMDGTLTCLTFDTARGYLAQRREAMAGQTSCTANAADLVTSWARDSALRLTQITRPDTSCLFYEYDTKGRLARTKRRDDCNAASGGERQEYIYDTEGLVTEIQTYDASNVLTAKQPFTYFDSRRLEKVVNPVNTSTWTGISYDSRGLVAQVDAAGSLGKTVFRREGVPGQEGRVTAVDKYKTSTVFDTWSLVYSWLGQQASVTDGDAKATQTIRDDLGRVVNVISPDKPNREKRTYDRASNLVTVVENWTTSSGYTHNFTFDRLGRPLTNDYAVGSPAGGCYGTTNPPEIQRVYDAAPSCPSSAMTADCTRVAGRLAYVRSQVMCSTGLGSDSSLDQETYYSYDDAGRLIEEATYDDVGGKGNVRVTRYAWSKTGELTQIITPSGATIAWGLDSASNNSDKDRITSVTRSASTWISNIEWNPYGPLKHYNQTNTLGGVAMRTRITRNLAYRPTGVYMETQTGSTVAHSVAITEDAKGRVTARDFTTASPAAQDSYFLYDDQDRVLCESSTYVTTCPTTGSTLKNNHSASPPFTAAGDWKTLKRPIPGSTGLTHQFTIGSSSHQITSVNQSDGSPVLGTTTFTYNSYYTSRSPGDRFEEWLGAGGSPTYRAYTYDNRHNVREIGGFRWNGSSWVVYFSYSGFDARNRRIYKSVSSGGTQSSWYYYYDPLDRLTEIRYTPNTSSSSTYTIFQLLWLGDRLTGYWQTDYPMATTTKRYVATDETGRPMEMWSLPPAGDSARVWAIDPSAWGFDTNLVGVTVFQPILFAGQYQDTETASYLASGTLQRPALALNGYRTYDPFTGSYLQVDPLVPRTWSSYGYVDSNPVGSKDPKGLARIACEYNPLQGGYMPDEDSGLGDPSNYSLGECDDMPGDGPDPDIEDGQGVTPSESLQCAFQRTQMNQACAGTSNCNGRDTGPFSPVLPRITSSGIAGSLTVGFDSPTLANEGRGGGRGRENGDLISFEEEKIKWPPPRPPRPRCDSGLIYCPYYKSCTYPDTCEGPRQNCNRCFDAQEAYDTCLAFGN